MYKQTVKLDINFMRTFAGNYCLSSQLLISTLLVMVIFLFRIFNSLLNVFFNDEYMLVSDISMHVVILYIVMFKKKVYCHLQIPKKSSYKVQYYLQKECYLIWSFSGYCVHFYFLLPMLSQKKHYFWSQVFIMEVLIDLHVLRSPESESIFSFI